MKHFSWKITLLRMVLLSRRNCSLIFWRVNIFKIYNAWIFLQNYLTCVAWILKIWSWIWISNELLNINLHIFKNKTHPPEIENHMIECFLNHFTNTSNILNPSIKALHQNTKLNRFMLQFPATDTSENYNTVPSHFFTPKLQKPLAKHKLILIYHNQRHFFTLV